ncbi:MAG: substrate-binding domain-containing protein [Bacteroidetes bacterium]|nr:substrate-binding domain-containing protein [Bacteroidota bacterium]
MRKLILLSLALFSLSCHKKEDKKNSPSYNKGEMTILTDDSYHSVVEALADGYQIHYPETKFTVKTMKEDLAFIEFLKGNVKLIAMSRDLSPKEKKEYEKHIELKYQPAKFAADAVLFVVSKDSPIQHLNLEDIKKGLVSPEKPFVFDGANSSNLNFVSQQLGLNPAQLKFLVVPGNEHLTKEITKHPNKIAVIGLNTISRMYSNKVDELRKNIRVLPIQSQGKLLQADANTLKDMSYPFTRVLYFLANEGNFNLANGFIRFSCTQLGQMIVEKEGLQPYNLYKREVQMNE